MKSFGKRLLATLLAVLMLGAIHPASVYAFDVSENVPAAEEPVVYTVTVQDKEIVKGESAMLSVSFFPYVPLQEYTIEWSSKSPNTVKIDADGTVQALRVGKAEITCTVLDGSDNVLCSTTCSVKVISKSSNTVKDFFEDALWSIFGPVIEPIANMIGEKVIEPIISSIVGSIIEGIINGIIDSIGGNKKSAF